jgi:hypothetical protein
MPADIGTAGIVGGGVVPYYENIIGGDITRVNTAVSNVPAGGAGTGVGALTAPDGNWDWIWGGYDNVVNGWACQIHGYHCKVNAGANHVTIAGGSLHVIDAGIAYPAIGGGTGNRCGGNAAVVGGGSVNYASGNYSGIFAGQNNIASGAAAIVGGGNANQATNSQATVSGGSSNQATAASATVSGGQSNLASGVASFVSGRENTASGPAAIAEGRDALATFHGGLAHGAGKFATQGDAQYQRLIARRITTDATPSLLYLDGASIQITLPATTTWAFSITVVARRTDSGEESAAYKFEGVVDRNAATALVGTVTKTVLAEDTAAWDCGVAVSSGALQITATGEAAKTIRWVASIEITSVSN